MRLAGIDLARKADYSAVVLLERTPDDFVPGTPQRLAMRRGNALGAKVLTFGQPSR